MPNKWWDEVTNGSNHKSKWLAEAMCHLATYYDQNFTGRTINLAESIYFAKINRKCATRKFFYLKKKGGEMRVCNFVFKKLLNLGI